MANSTQLLRSHITQNKKEGLKFHKNKGQMLIEALLIILFAIGTLLSLKIIEKIAKKEIQKQRLQKNNRKVSP